MADVAKAAGVSVATVSRAFNIPGAVREDVRKHVIATAERLGYTPNPAAKALRTRRSHIVGAVIPTLDYAIYAKLIDAFQATMRAEGQMVFILSAGFDNRRLFEPVRQLVEKGAEALLVVGRIEDEQLVEHLKSLNLPVVTTFSYIEDQPFASVGFDNYAATHKAIEYLIQLGHKQIAMLSGPSQGNDRQTSRKQAFVDALKAARIPGEPVIIESPVGYSMEFGSAATQHLLEDRPETTAILCNSDVLAFSAIAQCRKAGYRVPEDITIVGHDDLDFARLLEPALTTISVPAEEMGRKCARALLDALNFGRKPSSDRIPTSLTLRDSAAPPRRARLLKTQKSRAS
nr:LacI family DNA-binding transcriptional regulator [Cupriavidus sp. LEh25]